jgi:hypothetical protein
MEDEGRKRGRPWLAAGCGEVADGSRVRGSEVVYVDVDVVREVFVQMARYGGRLEEERGLEAAV